MIRLLAFCVLSVISLTQLGSAKAANLSVYTIPQSGYSINDYQYQDLAGGSWQPLISPVLLDLNDQQSPGLNLRFIQGTSYLETRHEDLSVWDVSDNQITIEIDDFATGNFIYHVVNNEVDIKTPVTTGVLMPEPPSFAIALIFSVVMNFFRRFTTLKSHLAMANLP